MQSMRTRRTSGSVLHKPLLSQLGNTALWVWMVAMHALNTSWTRTHASWWGVGALPILLWPLSRQAERGCALGPHTLKHPPATSITKLWEVKDGGGEGARCVWEPHTHSSSPRTARRAWATAALLLLGVRLPFMPMTFTYGCLSAAAAAAALTFHVR